ncbi:MAG: Do family serine endopeptidase [Burkholderiaceae bacterium]|jgi:serine protease Do|nr:Do family serine endopeptidase [Burkholderiaceae bacterium]
MVSVQAFGVRRAWMGWILAVAAACALFGLPQAAVARGDLPDFTELVDRVGPSVVGIRTLERTRSGLGLERGQLDPDVEEFLRRFGVPLPGRRGNPRGPDDEPQQRGVGSGFILSADGYIMTNAHVVDGADEVLVSLTDKREFKARIVGADRRTDVAVIKIEASGLPAVKLGDVNRLKVGEWVMAIGSPFGLANTVTAGIVSAKGRETGEFLPFIQTDVAINPGNSGGPLINLRGEVVGINSQIYSRSGGYMGIAFAIPIDEASRVADQLRASGRVVRGRIGVTIAPVTKDVAESIGLGKAVGAMVRAAEMGGPADKAGIEPGDIITRVDGRAVESSNDLPRIIGGIRPGSRAVLQVFRRGAYRDLSVTVGEFESESATRQAQGPGSAGPAARNALGLAVSDLREAERRELNVRGGVRVDAVEGAAARAGIREGDIILALDNTDITSARQFAEVAGRIDKQKSVSVLVRQGELTNFLVIRPQR